MKTLIYDPLDNHRVRCGMCHHFCTISEGQRGICQVRENREGVLYSLTYPKIIARGIDPIEKKPIFHLKPGSHSFSIATAGCNFKCTFCQNSSISQVSETSFQDSSISSSSPSATETKKAVEIPGIDTSPESIVTQALKAGCDSISYTYTEPTIYFELALKTAQIAKRNGLLNIFVTNGFMSKEVLMMAAPVLDAANVDLKAFTDDFYKKWCRAKLEPVKNNLILMRSLGILVEVTTLLIPGLNDHPDELAAMARFIAENLGIDTPWHISRFHPCYQMTDGHPTPISTLETAHRIGRDTGLRYVYTGNAPGLDSENTFCHGCGNVLIKRYAYQTKSSVTNQGTCPDCGSKIYGIF